MTTKAGAGRRARSAVLQLALVVLVGTGGCAMQSEVTDLWKDSSFTTGPIDNVLVVALRKDPVRRRILEDAFAKELAARGVSATLSYRLFPAEVPDTQEVAAAVRRDGYGAVLTSIRLPNETISTYVPGTVRREPMTVQDRFGGFHQRWVDIHDPGHTEFDEIRRVQIDVWSTGVDGRLIWSSTLRTLDSVDSRAMEMTVSRDIGPVLEKDGLLPPRKR